MVGEVEWLGHTVAKVIVVVVKRLWAVLVVGTAVVETVVEVHESCQSMLNLEQPFQAWNDLIIPQWQPDQPGRR